MQNLGLFLCSLDNLLQKNRNCFLFLEIKFQNGAQLKKMLFLTYFSHFLVTREKLQKFLQHISHSRTYMHFAHPIDFFALPILKIIRYGFSLVCVLVLILIRAILKQSINNKMVSFLFSKMTRKCNLKTCSYFGENDNVQMIWERTHENILKQ